MARMKPARPVARGQLLEAVRNVPEDARFLVGLAVNGHEDFLSGLCLNRSEFFTRAQILQQIADSDFQEFPTIPGFDSDLMLTPRLYVWKDSINQSQRFPATPQADTYTHVTDRCNPYHDIFFRLDRTQKTITFALGEKKKEIPVVEHTGWCWKPSKNGLLCQDMDLLERQFCGMDWNPIAVTIGRRVLRIKPAV